MKNKLLSVFLLLGMALALGSCGSSAPSDCERITLTGAGQGYNGMIKVSVVLEDGEIAGITVNEHQEDHIGSMVFGIMTRDMIRANSPEVDGISNATATSEGFRNAVSNALASADSEETADSAASAAQ